MAKQLNLLGTERVIPTALHAEMERSYLEYAMSVIVGRALPDVRDGLKPVHRRILYAMHELGLTPDRPYRKCARVVGDVLGKYHPHGDQAVYDAMVRLIQDFSSRYPLLAGHGNFGSVDNDPPAAMRYTETRLSPIGNEALLSEIGEATVDFINNFDGSQQEPVVLPAQLPILLLNGSSGIAVGMATNIPPHNLAEVVDALIALIDRPNLTDEKLTQLIPGPDFPTGGEIVETSGIKDAYSIGRGSIQMRGIAKLEQITTGRGRRSRRTAIVVSELPYQVNKAAWIEKMADQVNQGRIEGIADLRDESDREGIRVVIELKRDAKAPEVLQKLYQQTALQSNFGAIMLALVNGQPRQLTLRQLLEEFLSFREQTLTRQYAYELEHKQRRLHLVEGLLASLVQLDTMIDILRNAADGTSAKMSLQEQLNLSEFQADAILSMPLRRLTGLERQKLQTECEELEERIEQLQQLLSNRQELLKTLKKDLRALKRKYAEPRRTKIRSLTSEQRKQEGKGADKPASKGEQKTKSKKSLQSTLPIADEKTVLEFTYQGYVQRQRPATEQKSTSAFKQGDDFVIKTQLASTQEELAAITSSGKAYRVKIADIPP
ncbi:MAG: DNA topoisomerase 4 subunit A, partial [Merismopedia sp. SIO2A8]|nr:DNA topoisomerase 4 subunit A [Merismopedia sp. SIO2A8]